MTYATRRAALGVLVAVLVAVSVVGCGTDECSPEAREAALSRDVSAMLAGALSYSASIDREAQRIEQCGD